jgi:GNAT superfamily N-acetyltransferase
MTSWSNIARFFPSFTPELHWSVLLWQVGCKTLFVTSEGHPQLREIRPLCVLDFYVHESCQRSGIGRRLFDHMLTEESVVPAKLAYDRPSPKLIAFLRKHFGLSKYVPQTNNFVVFSQYFCEGPERAGRSLKQEDSVDGFSETRMKQQGNRSGLESGPSRTRLGTAFSRRSPAASDCASGHTAGAENDSMRGHGRRNSEGSQIFGKVDANARGTADWQAAGSNSLGSGPQCSNKHGSNDFCGQDKQAPRVPMHGRRSRRGSSEMGEWSPLTNCELLEKTCESYKNRFCQREPVHIERLRPAVLQNLASSAQW